MNEFVTTGDSATLKNVGLTPHKENGDDSRNKIPSCTNLMFY